MSLKTHNSSSFWVSSLILFMQWSTALMSKGIQLSSGCGVTWLALQMEGEKREVQFIILSRGNLSSTGSTEETTVRKGKFLCRNSAAPQLRWKKTPHPPTSTPLSRGLGVENGWIGLLSKSYLGRSPHTHFVISSAFFKTDTSFAD